MDQEQTLKTDFKRIPHAQTEPLESNEPLDYKLVGTLLDDKIRIDSVIGQGGMGVVYKGTHLVLNRPVAVKVIVPGAGFNEKAVMRLQQEAKAAFSLSHKNLASVHDISQTGNGLSYLVMDFADGQMLSDLLKRGPFDATQVVEIFSQVAEGLKEAHSQGVIHRDIKPSNIMVETLPTGTYQVKIIDFGIAKKVTENADEIQKLTQTGEVFGTPLYMSPEQCRGMTLDARSDIYSLGCVLYESLTGVPPFKGESAVATILQHLDKKVPTPDKQYNIPAPLMTVINKCLEKDNKDRYQTMDDLLNDLAVIKDGGITAGQPDAMLPARLKACLIDALVVATFGGLILLPQSIYLFFTTTGQAATGVDFTDWSFDKFASVFLVPAYLIGFAFGFAEGWITFFCVLAVVCELIIFFNQFTAYNLIYTLLSWSGLLALSFLNWLYHAGFESSRLLGTPGKVIFNLRVTSPDGHRLSFLQASARHLGRSLSSICTVTIVPMIAMSIRLCLQGRASEIVATLSNLGNSLTHCRVRQRHTSTRKSRVLWSVAVATAVLLPILAVSSSCFLSSVNPELATPSKISTPHSIPTLAYLPVSKSATIVTGYLLTPVSRKPPHLDKILSEESAESQRKFGLPVSANPNTFAKLLQGIDLSEITIGQSTKDGLIPVTVGGNLHIYAGKQTWMSSQYKRTPFSITYLIRWDQTSRTAPPVVVQVTEFVHGGI